jgi:hypothetical protein
MFIIILISQTVSYQPMRREGEREEEEGEGEGARGEEMG